MKNNSEEKYDITCVYIYKDKVAIVDKSVGKFPKLAWKKAKSSKKAVRKIIDYLVELITPERQEEINEIVDYFNKRLDKNTNPNDDKNQSVLLAFLKKNYSVDDGKKIIDNMIDEWLGNKEMAGNLNLPTLFKPCHIDAYLNRVKYKDPNKLQSKPTYDLDEWTRKAMKIRELF